MKPAIFFTFLGIFIIQGTEGKPTGLTTEKQEIAELITNELLIPFLERTKSYNETLQHIRRTYEKNIEPINSNVLAPSTKSTGTPDPTPSLLDSCKELPPLWNRAQVDLDTGALEAWNMTIGIIDALSNFVDCMTLNPFTDLRCVMHKIQNGRDVYMKYHDQLYAIEKLLVEDITNVWAALMKCIKRVRGHQND